jgi:Tfp pilus assembly protein PilO
MSQFKKKLLIQGSIFLALVLVLGGSLFFLGKKVSAYAAEIENTRQQLYDWIVSLESFAAIRSEYTSKGERYMGVLENRLPEKELLIDLKKEFQFLGASENVSVNLIFNSEVETSSPNVGAIGITLTVKGNYASVVRFISRLNEMRYLVSLESMTMSRGDDGVMDVEAKGRVFFKK